MSDRAAQEWEDFSQAHFEAELRTLQRREWYAELRKNNRRRKRARRHQK